MAQSFYCVVQCVCSPRDLPGTKVVLAALLVEVSEDQKDQQGYNTGNQDQTCGDCVHGSGSTARENLGPIVAHLAGTRQ